MNKIYKALGMLLLSAVSMLFKAWVVFYGYTNGLIPLGMPEIGYFHLIGLMALIYLFSINSAELRAAEKDNEDGKVVDRVILSWIVYLIVWLIFWLAF